MNQHNVKQARQYIRIALVAAVGLVVWSLVVVLLAALHVGNWDQHFTVWALVDIAVFAGLAFGLYRRSLPAAIGLVLFWMFNKGYQYIAEGRDWDLFPFMVTALLSLGAFGVWIERRNRIAQPKASNRSDIREAVPRTLFLIGAGFTKAIHPSAPLNDDLLSAVVGPAPDCSALGRAWGKYGEPDIEKLLTRFDLDLLANREGWNRADRREIEAQLAGYVRRFRFKEDSPWLAPFLEVLQDNDVIVSLNYDCALEGFLDYHEAWSPRGGYCRVENPLADELPENSRNIRILKIHGSESFRRGPFGDRSDYMRMGVEINESLFPRSGKSRHFGGGIDSNPYVIAPSYVKRQAYDLHHLVLDALRFAEQAKNLVVIGCSLRPEDGHLFLILTNFLTGQWREKRIFIVDPQATGIGNRLEQFVSRAIFDEKNLVPLDGLLQDRLDELRECLNHQ